MARLSHALGVAPATSPEQGSAELTQLLARLEHTILQADQERERRLRTSEYERARINNNLDYARKLLTRLEQEALGAKFQPRRLDVQSHLNRKRELLDKLFDRMHDLSQLHEDGDDDEDDSSEGEDILRVIIPTPSDSMDSRSTGAPTESTGFEEDGEYAPDTTPASAHAATSPTPSATISAEAPSTAAPTQPSPAQPTQSSNSPANTAATTTTSSTLRARGSNQSQLLSQDTGLTTARAALFASRRNNNNNSTSVATTGSKAPGTTQASTATAEAILDHQRAEQDLLSDSILKMAGALKTSSQRFSDTLEQDKANLEKAGSGMERTEKGMESAGRRMGALRKMTEGKGWWGRMILFAWVYGLMVALILIVFVMPKLRF